VRWWRRRLGGGGIRQQNIEKYKLAIGGGGAAATRWPPVENIRASSWRQNPAATRRSRLQDLSSPKCASPTTGRTDSHNHHKQLTHNHNTSQHPHRHSLRDQHHGKPATPAPPAPVANRDETPSPPAPRRPPPRRRPCLPSTPAGQSTLARLWLTYICPASRHTSQTASAHTSALCPSSSPNPQRATAAAPHRNIHANTIYWPEIYPVHPPRAPHHMP